MSLNSNACVAVRLREHERRIVVSRGEAYFNVAHDASRPFIVVAGSRQVVALGTVFSVRYEGDRIVVALVEGKVQVKPIDEQAAPTHVLVAGERLTVSSRDEQVDKPQMSAVTAWRRGELILDETSLADAIRELNRYDRISLGIEDASVASLPVSGIYRTGDSAGFARIVARLYGLELDQEGDRITLRARR